MDLRVCTGRHFEDFREKCDSFILWAKIISFSGKLWLIGVEIGAHTGPCNAVHFIFGRNGAGAIFDGKVNDPVLDRSGQLSEQPVIGEIQHGEESALEDDAIPISQKICI